MLLIRLVLLVGAAIAGLLAWLFRRRRSHPGSDTRWTATRLPPRPLAPIASVEDQVEGVWPWER